MVKKRVLNIAGGRGGAFIAADNLVNAVNRYSQEFEAEVLMNRQSSIQRFKSKSLTLFQSVTATGMYEFHSAKSIATLKLADIEKYSPDLIHIHNWYNLLDSELINKLMDLYPTIFTLHDERMLTGGCHMTFGCVNYRKDCKVCPAEKYIHGETNKSKIKMSGTLKQHSPIHTIVPSQWLFEKVKEEISSSDFSSLYKVRNLVDSVFTSNLNGKLGDRSNYDLRVIFIAANLNSNVKNLKSLFVALAELLSNHSKLKIELTLVGGGKVELPQNIHNLKIQLKESLSPAKILMEFEKQDLCIVPSLSENRPNVIIESMLAGVFVIASKIGGIPEMVEDDVTGYLCAPNATGIREALERYLGSSQSKLRAIRKLAQESASQEHEPFKIVQEHESIYRNVYSKWDNRPNVRSLK